ncbi:MAG TPA: ATP-binding protein, partial [Quisquiliibacterium sp.]|nr:ATP-binding protein [Quisquiliibacterium sp.]
RDYDASIPDIRGDKEQLMQVVLNLVSNAAQVMEGQGRILLKTRIARQVTIAKRRHRLALDLHVIDNGPGIPEAIRERIFFPLVSGREGGSGLGLSLAQSFVQQHGGLIECESRPGRTDFRILLPMS